MYSKGKIPSGTAFPQHGAQPPPITIGLCLNRDSFQKMIDSVKTPFPECIDYLVQNIELDPYFNEYFQWALQNDIPTVVVSSGMEPIIRAILKNLVGPDHDKLDIVSNEVMARPGMSIDQEGGWTIKYHDERYV